MAPTGTSASASPKRNKRKAEDGDSPIATKSTKRRVAKVKSPSSAAATTTSTITVSPASSPAKVTRKNSKQRATTTTTSTANTKTEESFAVSFSSNTNENEMPLPPTALKRTQSTPLELELQQQVIANVQADMEQKPPPFTVAPPDHLLKFAPTEPEEGYEITGHEEDEDETMTAKMKKLSLRKAARDPGWLVVLGQLFFFVYFYGDVMHEFFHMFATQIPLPFHMNPYRTPNGLPVPLMPCYFTNVQQPPVHYRSECRNDQLPFLPCPTLGKCWGGDLQACGRTTETYFEVAANGKECLVKPPIQEFIQNVAQQIHKWTLESNDTATTSTTGGVAMASPKPHFTKPLDGEIQQPMFHVDHLFDIDPFLLKPIQQYLPGGGRSMSPVETLYALLEETRPLLSACQLKLITEVRVDYVTNVVAVWDEEQQRDVRREVQVPQDVHYLGIDPVSEASQHSWQCAIQGITHRDMTNIQSAMKLPWLILLWGVSMVMMVVWLAVLNYYLYKARQQKQLLQLVEDVREFVLETLKASSPKQWKGFELQNHAKANCPALKQDSTGDQTFLMTSFPRYVWPRVVFDLGGNKNLARSITVANADLIDLWAWQPQPEEKENKQKCKKNRNNWKSKWVD